MKAASGSELPPEDLARLLAELDEAISKSVITRAEADAALRKLAGETRPARQRRKRKRGR